GRMREGSRGSNLPLPSRQSQRNALSPKAGVLAAAAYEQRHRAGERGLSFKNPQNQFMMTRRRRQRNSLPEIDFVAVKNYRRAPAESESKNDIDNVEDHLALRSRRWIPRRKKHQVERDVDRICVAEIHRIAAHPPDPGRINQQNNSQQRPKDRIRCAAQPLAKKNQARGRTLEMKRLQDVGQCENCEQDRQGCQHSATPGISHRMTLRGYRSNMFQAAVIAPGQPATDSSADGARARP